MIKRFLTVAGMITLDGTFWFFLLFLFLFRLIGFEQQTLLGFVAVTLLSAFLAAGFVAVGTATFDYFLVSPIDMR